MMLQTRLLFLILVLALFGACADPKNDNENTDDVKRKPEAEQTIVKKNMLIFGTSLTAGLGLELEEAYPALLQNKIDSLSLPYHVINAGLSGETTAGGKSRIDWLLKQKIDVFVLELGANDGLRGISVASATDNLQYIIDQVKKKNPKATLVMVGMQAPPNLGDTYTTEFKNMFPKLATKNNMTLVPFLLDKVGGVPSLNQPDGIHPTAAGAKILADNVWAVLKEKL